MVIKYVHSHNMRSVQIKPSWSVLMTQDIYADLRNLLDENLNIKSICELAYHTSFNHPNRLIADPNQLAAFDFRFHTAKSISDPMLEQLSQMIQRIQAYISDENAYMASFALYEDLNAWKTHYTFNCCGIVTELELYLNSLSS